MRQGLAGFYGNHKPIISGFFRPSYSVTTVSDPIFTGTISDISELYNSGSYMYDFTTYFTYATSYAISPDLETGWIFSSGTLTIDTDELGNFGPFTVTGINSSGQTDSNTFTIQVAVTTPTPSGISRTITSSGQNRSLSSKNTNRVIKFANKNRS